MRRDPWRKSWISCRQSSSGGRDLGNEQNYETMSTRRPHKSRKAPRRPPVTIPPNEVATRDSPYRVVPDINSAEVTTEGSASPPSAHFVQNYLVSILFHAYIAFAPVLLLPILRRTSLFGNWSSNAITALSVFLSNASWMELFNFNCTADAGHAFIAAVQEKRFLASCGSSLAPAKKRAWLLGGISGVLGALTVGLLIAAFNWLNPFGDILPLPQELFRMVGRTDKEASILADAMQATMTHRQRTLAAESFRTVAISLAESCPTVLVPLMFGLQNTLQSRSSYEVFRAVSLLFDTFVAEFLCCFIVYSVSAVFTSVGFYLELRHAQRLNLAVLLFAVVAGLPFCAVVGGPMLGISFAALVAASRLDPWCFMLTASADLLAALGATFCVRPEPNASSCIRTLETKKSE